MLSRESSFLFNNLILLASCFAVLWGTLFPVISEAATGNKISLDADWYNRLMVPIGLFLLLLTGVGPLFAWRRTSIDSLRRNFQYPGIASLVLVGALVAAGVSAVDAIGAASWRARSFLGINGPNEGGLVDGSPADVVVYADDPRRDIDQLDSPIAVVLRGRLRTP